MKQKLVSVLLVICFLLQSLSVTAFAASATDDEDSSDVVIETVVTLSDIDALDADASDDNASDVDTPDGDMSDANVPDNDALDADILGDDVLDANTPDVDANYETTVSELQTDNPDSFGLQVYASGQTQITDDAQSVSRDTVLVLDNSISMEGRPLIYLKQAAIKFCDSVLKASGVNRVAIVVYDTNIYRSIGFTDSLDDLTTVINNMNGLGDWTDINAGLKRADDFLKGSDAEIKNIVVMTDGVPTHGEYQTTGRYSISDYAAKHNASRYCYEYANALYNTATSLFDDYKIYSLGFFHNIYDSTLVFAEKVLWDIQNAGYYQVTNVDDLEFVFGQVAGDVAGESNASGKFRYRGNFNATSDTEAEYFYDDAYFFRDTNKYYSDLSTMSLCLELSTWSSYNNEDVWYNPSLTPNDDDYWKDTLVNAKTLLLGDPKAGDGYGGIGFQDFAASEDWQKRPTKDSIGAIAARKEIKDENDNKYTLVALAVRGGGYGSEWASNFTLGRSGEHEGFSKAKDDVLDFLYDYLDDVPDDELNELKLWVVGYSRAGITANMVAGELNKRSNSLLPDGVSLKQENIYCYAFEPPMGIMENQDDGSHTNIHNIVNLNDLVPLVAPEGWSFTRYNEGKDWLLPTSVNNDSWDDQFADMKQELRKLGFDPSKDYTIDDVQQVSNFNVDLSKWLPFGDPLWWWEDDKRLTHDILEDGIAIAAEDILQGRQYYSSNTEYGVRQISGILFHYSGMWAGFQEYAQEVGGTLMSFDEFLERLEDLFTWETVKYIVQPAIALNLDSPTKRIDKVKDRAEQKVLTLLGGIGGEIGEMKIFAGALADGFGNLFGGIALDLLDSNTNTLNNTWQFTTTLGTGFQAHYADITLAWVRSQDKNYNPNAIAEGDYASSSTTRIIRINCPVDVYTYNSEGILVASIKDDSPQDVGSIVSLVNTADEKILYLPGDGEYTVEMRATGEGTVYYSIIEYNYALGEVTSAQSYSVEVSENDKLTGIVPNISKNSSATYQLKDSMGSLIDYNVFDPDQKYTVTVIKQSDDSIEEGVEISGGYVSGAGEYQANSFAKILAQPLPGAEFQGFFVDGAEVSDVVEETHNGSTWYAYRFCVDSDIEVTAQFSDIKLYNLTINSGAGGTVNNESGYLGAGMTVQLEAVPNNGYTFAGWSISNGGFIDDMSNPNAVFTMPEEDSTIIAKFSVIRVPSTGDDWVPSGGDIGDSSDSDPTYSIKIPSRVTGGTVKVTPTSASEGQRVTITVKANSGYELDALTVADSKGNTLTLTDQGNGKYTFTMPKGNVSVDAQFQRIESSVTPVQTVSVNPTNDKLEVDGKSQTPAAYKINDYNYFKLRDIAALLNGTGKQFSVGYESSTGEVSLTSGQPYEVTASDLTALPAESRQATISTNVIYINGVRTQLTIYKIDGYNYFKLRDLASALDFYVGWTADRGMFLESDKPYSE